MTLAWLIKRLREETLKHPEISNMPIAIAGADAAGDLTFLQEDFMIWIGKHRTVLEGIKKKEVK